MSSAARLRVRPAEARDLDRVCAIVNHFIETTAFNFRIEFNRSRSGCTTGNACTGSTRG